MLEAFQLFGHDVALVDFDLAVFQHADDGLAGEAVEEGVGVRRVHFAILDEEDVGPGGFGHIAAVVEHHGVGAAFGLCGML